MKNYIFIIVLIILSGCESKKAKNEKMYNTAMQKGDLIKAEYYLDEIIKSDKTNVKYLKLKVPLLLNDCKKEEAMIIIDNIISKEPDNFSLLFTKAMLLSSNNKQKKELLMEIDNKLSNQLRHNNLKEELRLKGIGDLILVKKILNLQNDIIKKQVSSIIRNNDESEVLKNNINLSTLEIQNIFILCNESQNRKVDDSIYIE